ncbi:MAG: acyl carrier protein [Oscillospiraceae bacterium]|nr:acyl carrier protein [Oscillospiraceae bacterium]
MTTEEIVSALDAFVREHFEVEPDDADYSTEINLFDYGYVDSMGATEIILFAEERFGVHVTQKDVTLYPMNSVSEIAQVISRKIGA